MESSGTKQEIAVNSFEYWLQIGIVLGPMLVMLGATFEKVRQIEKRLNGGGTSIPGECKVHTQRLDNHDRRLTAIEEAKG